MSTQETERSSTLPLGLEQVTFRISPAAFSRVIGVSKQAVSTWISAGVLVPSADGKLDPAVAARQLVERGNPKTVRSIILKPLVAEHAELRQRIAALEAELARSRDEYTRRAEQAVFVATESEERRLFDFCEAIEQRFAEGAQAFADGRLQTWLDELYIVVCRGWDLEEYRASLDDSGDEDEGDG